VRARPAESDPTGGVRHGDFLDGPPILGQSCASGRDLKKY
jgi:hypothetical protein